MLKVESLSDSNELISTTYLFKPRKIYNSTLQNPFKKLSKLLGIFKNLEQKTRKNIIDSSLQKLLVTTTSRNNVQNPPPDPVWLK